MRPTIDEYFMNIAEVVATRSTCLRNNVGAVIVRDKRIISTGYNGAPRNLEHCLDIGCIRDQENIESGTMHEICRAVHAEQNAIIQAALHGVSTKGTTIYCTHQPCILCTKMIINAHIVRVVFRDAYPDTMAIEFFAAAGIEVVRVGGANLLPLPDQDEYISNRSRPGAKHKYRFDVIYCHARTRMRKRGGNDRECDCDLEGGGFLHRSCDHGRR